MLPAGKALPRVCPSLRANNNMTAETAYLAKHAEAMAAIKAITDAIHDLPAPSDERPITWGNVGDMARYASALSEIAEISKS